MIDKTTNKKAWLFVIPVVILVAFNALIPLMTVVNYSVQETFGNNVFFWEGVKWFEQVLNSDRFHDSFMRQLSFTGMILIIEVPLGIAVALTMPRKGPWVSVCLVLMALPLLIPWNVVGAMWNIFALPDTGLLGYGINKMGIHYDFTQQPIAAWLTTKRVLTIAILLRFMDSFMIYTEPFVLTGGGPGNTTTFLSIDLVKIALGQFDLGPAAAMSLIYFFVVLLVCWVFYTLMMRDEQQ
jgi:glycerol transport system permease protein